MKLDFYPRYEWQNGNQVILRNIGYVVIKPDSYNPDKKYPLFMFIHGIGERNDGSLNALHYLVDQHSWGSIIPLFAQQACDIYDIIIVAPNYAGEFSPTNANFVLDSTIMAYSIDVSKIGMTGFSLGGGAVLRYLCSSQSNVNRLAVAIPVAPVAWYTKTDFIKNSGIPVWFHVNTNDTNAPTNLSVTLNELNEINSTSPPIPAVYTAYKATGHGGQNDAWGLNPVSAPGGQGLVSASVNIYEWLLMNTNTNHKAVPTGSLSTTTSTTKLDNSILAIAGSDKIVTSPNIFLDGRSSINYKNAYASWQVIRVPQGENVWNIVKSGGWITSDAVLKSEGEYEFKLTLKSGEFISTDTVVYTYSKSMTTTTSTTKSKVVLSRTEVPNIGRIIIIYDDGSIGYEDI